MPCLIDQVPKSVLPAVLFAQTHKMCCVALDRGARRHARDDAHRGHQVAGRIGILLGVGTIQNALDQVPVEKRCRVGVFFLQGLGGGSQPLIGTAV